MSFVSEMTSHLAWPSAAIVLLIIFRNELVGLLPRIERVKHKDTEIAFSKAIKAVVESAEEVEESGRVLALEFKSEEERLKRKIDIAPHAVVHQAYSLVDRELLELYDAILGENVRKRLSVGGAKKIRKEIGFSAEIEDSIRKLRGLRSMIMINRSYYLSFDLVDSYLELALDTASQVREYNANNRVN